MDNINFTRVLLGGLLAGLVITVGEYILNGIILADAWATHISERGLPKQGTLQARSFFVVDLLVGIGLVWIYAAIRPRFGQGPKTAIIAGLTVWAIGWLFIDTYFYIAGISTAQIFFTTTLWGFFEVPVAAIAGAWIYRED